jgi:hypothetical protein
MKTCKSLSAFGGWTIGARTIVKMKFIWQVFHSYNGDSIFTVFIRMLTKVRP